jgi:hypothetical protein
VQLGAGVNPDTDEIVAFADLNDHQAVALGLPPEPALLGCGQMACAYLSESGHVVKITRDVRDARMSYVVMSNPQPWAIPIRGVWRLPEGFYAITADLADPIDKADPSLADAFNWVWRQVAEANLPYERWYGFRDITEANLDDDAADAGGESPLIAERRRALALANDAHEGFAKLGMGWLDFHGGNWGIYGGKPVVIDLGLSNPLEEPPVRALAEVRQWLPRL